MYDCIWSNLSLAHTPFYFSYSYHCLTLFISPPPAPYLPSTHTAKYCVMQECVSVCVCTVHVCKQRCTVFHSWIKPGQRPRGLQVNVAYFKRLFLHGHRVSEAHLHTHAFREEGKKKNHSKKKPQDVVYTFVYFLCVLLNQPAVCHYAFLFFFLFSPISLFRTSVTLSAFSVVTPLSFCPVLLSFYFYIYFYPVFSFISFPFVSSVILAIN